MTATLLVLMPVALFVLVSGFCFVGCSLDTEGNLHKNPPPPRKPFTTYSRDDVVGHLDIAAYWPLNEQSPPDDSVKLIAHDALGAYDGEYKHKGNGGDLYFPCVVVHVVPGIIES